VIPRESLELISRKTSHEGGLKQELHPSLMTGSPKRSYNNHDSGSLSRQNRE